jgi:hypothetical protein
MDLFSGSELDCRVMEKSGCVSYSYTPWVSEKKGVYERAIYYKSEKRISRYKVEVTSTQQKTILDGNGWLVEEVMNFHGVPLGDYFNVSKSIYQVPCLSLFLFNKSNLFVIYLCF